MTYEEKKLYDNFWFHFEKDIIELNDKTNKKIKDLPTDVQIEIFKQKNKLINTALVYLAIKK